MGNPSALWEADQNLFNALVSAQSELFWMTLAPAELLKYVSSEFL